MWISVSREELKEIVKNTQRTNCDYDGFPNREMNRPVFCDCKYGFDGIKKNGEQNGCPEFRVLSLLLSKMTDAEYLEILNR